MRLYIINRETVDRVVFTGLRCIQLCSLMKSLSKLSVHEKWKQVIIRKVSLWKKA